MRITPSALPGHAVSLCRLGFRQRRKPVLPDAALRADAAPTADHRPVSEQSRLDIDLIKPGQIAARVASLHVDGQHWFNLRDRDSAVKDLVNLAHWFQRPHKRLQSRRANLK